RHRSSRSTCATLRRGRASAGQRLLTVASIVDLFDDAGTTSLTFDAVRAAFSSPAGHRAIAKEFIQEITQSTRGKLKVKSVSFGRVVTLTAGQGSFRILMKIRTNVGP